MYIDGMPRYSEYLNQSYEKAKAKYMIIASKGLNIDDYLNIRALAEQIVFNIGDKCRGRYVYTGYGLKIEYGTSLRIIFNDELVLNDVNYFPGKWEEIIRIIGDKLPLIINEKKRKQKTINNILFLVSLIKNKEIVVNSNIKIVKILNSQVDEEREIIRVEENGIVTFVYSVYKSTGSVTEELLKYEIGEWENDVNQYVSNLKHKASENAAEENIKLLRRRYN